MVPTKTVIIVIVGGLALVGLGIYMYNGWQVMFKDEYNRLTDRELESYKHLGEYNRAHPERYYFDNKTGLWMYRHDYNPASAPVNPNSTLLRNQSLSSSFKTSAAFSFDPSIEEESEPWSHR